MRRKILKKVDEIEAKHCKDCTILADVNPNTKHRYCISKCPVGSSMSRLGNQLLELSKQKAYDILAKGNQMTIKDVKYLLNKGFDQLEIGNAMEMSNYKRNKFFAELGFKEESTNKAVKKRGTISIQKRVFDLLAKGDLPPEEIAAKLKINKNTARRYRSDFRRQA